MLKKHWLYYLEKSDQDILQNSHQNLNKILKYKDKLI